MPPSGLNSLLWFIAVLAMIPIALWLFKRSPAGARFAAGGTGGAALRSVATLPLSPSQRIVTIEVGQGDERRWLVLGVTPQSITPLHTLLPPADVPGAATAGAPGPGAAGAFSQALARLRPTAGHDDER